MSEIRITLTHVRQARISGAGVLCAPGIRAWAARNGVDMRRLAREGLPISEVETMDDAFAQRVLEIARAEAGGCDG